MVDIRAVGVARAGHLAVVLHASLAIGAALAVFRALHALAYGFVASERAGARAGGAAMGNRTAVIFLAMRGIAAIFVGQTRDAFMRLEIAHRALGITAIARGVAGLDVPTRALIAALPGRALAVEEARHASDERVAHLPPAFGVGCADRGRAGVGRRRVVPASYRDYCGKEKTAPQLNPAHLRRRSCVGPALRSSSA